MEDRKEMTLDEMLSSFPFEQEVTEVAQIPENAVLPEVVRQMRENPPHMQQMKQNIEDMDEYAHSRGTMGLDFGFQCLNDAFNGCNPGLHLVAGGANTGKSAMLLEMSRRIAAVNQFQNENHPKKAHSIYFSLDDTLNELLPRMIASQQRITINQALFPKLSENKPVIKQKREQGIKELLESTRYFSMFDASLAQTIQAIRAKIKNLHDEFELIYPGEFQFVIFIDNFHDITVDPSLKGYTEDNARFDYIAGELNQISIDFNCAVICSAEFRKINSLKRPQEDDIKSSGLLAGLVA